MCAGHEPATAELTTGTARGGQTAYGAVSRFLTHFGFGSLTCAQTRREKESEFMPLRIMVLSLLVLFALIVGLIVGVLSALGGVHAALAVVSGLGASGSTV